MKNTTKKFGRGSTVVPALMGIVLAGALALPAVTAEAAQYVDGKRCAGDAVELPSGKFKCRTVDGGVAEGAGYSAEKGRPKTPLKTTKSERPETTK
jgi:hypothetical protein